MKDSRDDGCLCHRCKTRYKVDLRVDDELWDRIHQQWKLLCGACILTLLEQEGQFAYYDLKVSND